LEGISGDEGAAITRINASVNTLENEVSGIKTDVTDLYSDVERMSNSIENKADVSVLGNYALKTDLNDYPTNSSVSSTYATKAQVQGCIDEGDLEGYLTEQGYITNNDVSQFATERWVNENYCDLENIDEIILNVIDNNLEVTYKVNEIVNESSSFADISTNVKDISTLVTNVSTKLDRDYLTAQTINTDFVKNTSLNTTLAGYVTKTQMNSSLLTKQDSLPFSDESDEIMDNDNLGIAGLAVNSVNGVDEYGILVTDGFEKDE
jgi:archaellum component FlaC